MSFRTMALSVERYEEAMQAWTKDIGVGHGVEAHYFAFATLTKVSSHLKMDSMLDKEGEVELCFSLEKIHFHEKTPKTLINCLARFLYFHRIFPVRRHLVFFEL